MGILFFLLGCWKGRGEPINRIKKKHQLPVSVLIIEAARLRNVINMTVCSNTAYKFYH